MDSFGNRACNAGICNRLAHKFISAARIYIRGQNLHPRPELINEVELVRTKIFGTIFFWFWLNWGDFRSAAPAAPRVSPLKFF